MCQQQTYSSNATHSNYIMCRYQTTLLVYIHYANVIILSKYLCYTNIIMLCTKHQSYYYHHTLQKWKLPKISPFKTITLSQSGNYRKSVFPRPLHPIKVKIIENNSFYNTTPSQRRNYKNSVLSGPTHPIMTTTPSKEKTVWHQSLSRLPHPPKVKSDNNQSFQGHHSLSKWKLFKSVLARPVPWFYEFWLLGHLNNKCVKASPLSATWKVCLMEDLINEGAESSLVSFMNGLFKTILHIKHKLCHPSDLNNEYAEASPVSPMNGLF